MTEVAGVDLRKTKQYYLITILVLCLRASGLHVCTSCISTSDAGNFFKAAVITVVENDKMPGEILN